MRARDNAVTVETICERVTMACKGLPDKIEPPRFDDQIFFDGQPIPVVSIRVLCVRDFCVFLEGWKS